MPSQHDPSAEQRLQQIQRARVAVFENEDEGARASRRPGELAASGLLAMRPDSEWIERSWRRCLAQGQRPQHRVAFDVVTSQSQVDDLLASLGF